MKINAVIVIVIMMFVSTNVQANETMECLDLTPSQMISHDLNEPSFHNCYIVDNEANKGFFVTLIMFDGLKGTLDIQQYNSSTGLYTEIDNQTATDGTVSYFHDKDIGNSSYVLRLDDLTYPKQKKRVGVVKSVSDGIIHLVITVNRYAQEEPPHV